jgi:site-specific DNA-cytosine methylase
MIVLSLFDGMACGYEALKRANIPVTKYYASEIDKYAIQIALKNHPDIIELGDINDWESWNIAKPDLIIGGSPCQGFSTAGKGLAFEDPRSKLFFIMMDIIKHYNPKYKLLENVKMKQEWLDIISSYMGVTPMFINSNLVSAQNRQRYYWFNWEAPLPKDKGIFLTDVLENGVVNQDKSYCIDANYFKGGNLKSYFEKHRRQLVFNQPCRVSERGRKLTLDGSKRDDVDGLLVRGYEGALDKKTNTLTTVLKDNYILEDYIVRKLTPIECERLQTLPDNYTAGVSNTQRYKMLGNGWTVDVITHLFKHMIDVNKD